MRPWSDGRTRFEQSFSACRGAAEAFTKQWEEPRGSTWRLIRARWKQGAFFLVGTTRLKPGHKATQA